MYTQVLQQFSTHIPNHVLEYESMEENAEELNLDLVHYLQAIA